MFFWKDPGKELDEKLAKMSREEMEDELVSSMEFERIYGKYHACICNLIKAKQENELSFSKEWIKRLERPEIGADFNDLHWDLICRLKEELVIAVKLAGFTVEDDAAYSVPIERSCDEDKTKLVKYLAYKNQKYLIGDFVQIKEYRKEELKGRITSFTEHELIQGVNIKTDSGKLVQIAVTNIERLCLADAETRIG